MDLRPGQVRPRILQRPEAALWPLIRRGDTLEETDWAEAYSQILPAFAEGGASVAALGGATCSNEDLYMLQKVFRGHFRSNNVDHRFQRFLPKAGERLETTVGLPQVTTTIESLENRRAIAIFGTSLADDEPIMFLRVRKAWFNNGTKVVVAHHAPTDADSFADVILRYREGTELVVAAGLANAVLGGGKVKDAALADKVKKFTPEYVEEATGVKAADLRAAALLLADEQAPILTTRALLDLEQGMAVAETLAAVAKAAGSEFNFYGLRANDEGADRLGVLPDMAAGGLRLEEAASLPDFAETGLPREAGLNTHQILEACAAGVIKALWLVDVDPFASHFDRDLVQRALENVEFLVYQGIAETEAMHYASVVLPQTAPRRLTGPIRTSRAACSGLAACWQR